MSGKHAVRQAAATVPLSPQSAFKQVVYDFGVKNMAAALLMHEGTLQNKCNSDEGSHHKPTLKDVVDVTRASGDTRILESLDRLFGRAGYELAAGPVSDEALMELLCKVSGEHGAMHQALLKALADSKFCKKDLQDVRAEAFDLISAVMNFVQRLEGLVDA